MKYRKYIYASSLLLPSVFGTSLAEHSPQNINFNQFYARHSHYIQAQVEEAKRETEERVRRETEERVRRETEEEVRRDAKEEARRADEERARKMLVLKNIPDAAILDICKTLTQERLNEIKENLNSRVENSSNPSERE